MTTNVRVPSDCGRPSGRQLLPRLAGCLLLALFYQSEAAASFVSGPRSIPGIPDEVYPSPGEAGSNNRADTAMELDLAQAVRLALDNDSRIYSSHWQAEAARHAAALAWRGSLPQGTASRAFGRQRIDYGSGSTISGSANTRNSGLDVNWTVFEFGAGRHRIAAGKDREAAATLREARTRDIAIFDVVIAYFDLYRLRHLLTINQ